MPLASLASLDPICSDWLSSHTSQAVLLEVEQSASNIYCWDWVSKLAQPLKYRSYKPVPRGQYAEIMHLE